MEHQPEICAHIAGIIRSRSETGQLIEAEEIRTELARQGVSALEDCDRQTFSETRLNRVLEEHPDLRKISVGNGMAYYHSIESLSASYAGILVRKSENPLWMIAEAVRESSRLYPRPVPQDSFLAPPFGLARKEIEECLTRMGQEQEYHDIAQTTTSIGTHFLYSTQYLEPAHASMLAEWLDVGQTTSP